jgi:hypothetical protein
MRSTTKCRCAAFPVPFDPERRRWNRIGGILAALGKSRRGWPARIHEIVTVGCAGFGAFRPACRKGCSKLSLPLPEMDPNILKERDLFT